MGKIKNGEIDTEDYRLFKNIQKEKDRVYSKYINEEYIMEEFINYLRLEDKDYTTEILERYARYIDENLDNRCPYCVYNICNEHDNCFDGILENLKEKIKIK